MMSFEMKMFIFYADYCSRFQKKYFIGIKILILGYVMLGLTACNNAELEEQERQRRLEEEQTKIQEEKRIEEQAKILEQKNLKEELRLKEEDRLKNEAHLEKTRLKEEDRLAKEAREQKELAAMRERLRAEAVGKKLEILETTNGKAYKNVIISSVSAVGFSIQHESGTARIQFEDLSEAMQKEYLYDPEEKRKLMDSQRKLQNSYEMQISEVAPPLPQNESGSKKSASTRPGVDVEKKRILTANLSAYNQKIRHLESEIGSLQSELSSDLLKDSNHRTNRKSGGISRAPQIREKLNENNRQLADARQKAAAIASELNSM